MAEPSARPPRWVPAASDLRRQIKNGTYPPGSQLPTVPEIQERYSIGNRSAREVQQALIAEGLATARKRQGVYVTGDTDDGTAPQRAAPRRTHSARRQRPADAPTTGDEDLTTAATADHRDQPPPDVALILQIDTADPVDIRTEELHDDHGPVAVRTAYTARPTSAPPTVITHTSARHPTQAEADALEIPRAGIVLVHDETHLDRTGPAVLTRTAYRADRIRLSDQYRPE
ncbi:DNA-binding GntR family transcriptional regulator [Nocardiopsis mwathae]|uniref:DNA-binding GntR family transcriptional regulator n=1 Tax=Nocardiopsis mwathae TaxID=1472723 RepID=A0A7W9YEJ2_9ACTN|nr:GntR family transcriptional regulator [Nocardiopsis mwathae]MBB6170723.1 DNA-binding GntR family transcriptional regulator [Nocardiopsis mwathae]